MILAGLLTFVLFPLVLVMLWNCWNLSPVPKPEAMRLRRDFPFNESTGSFCQRLQEVREVSCCGRSVAALLAEMLERFPPRLSREL